MGGLLLNKKLIMYYYTLANSNSLLPKTYMCQIVTISTDRLSNTVPRCR